MIIFEIYSKGLVHTLINVIKKNVVRWSNSQDRKWTGLCFVSFGFLDLSKACFNVLLFCLWYFNNFVDDDLTWSKRTWNEHLIINKLFIRVIIMGLFENITFNISEVSLSWVPSLSFVTLVINHYFSIWVFVSDHFWIFNNH